MNGYCSSRFRIVLGIVTWISRSFGVILVDLLTDISGGHHPAAVKLVLI